MDYKYKSTKDTYSHIFKECNLTKKQFPEHKTVIQINDNTIIGGLEICIMAGPCAIESYEQLVELGLFLKNLGVSVLRGSAYKPRTSPYSFQGLGLQALKWHKQAQSIHRLAIETEVLDPRDVETVNEYVDILRIGARNMQNFPLLKEAGFSKKPIILKRGFSSTLSEWLLSAEYILHYGNSQVILCERGIRTFETASRFTLDFIGATIIKNFSHLPIIIDPSHAAGNRSLVPDLTKAALNLGIDGVIVEVHQNPNNALCDSLQALSPEMFQKLMADIRMPPRLSCV